MHHLTVSTASNAQRVSSVPRGKSLTASAKKRARFLGRREANKTSLAPSRPTTNEKQSLLLLVISLGCGS